MKAKALFIISLAVLAGCKTPQKIVYAQQAGSPIQFNDSLKTNTPDAVLKPGDLLVITVNSATPEAALPFNLPLTPSYESMKSYEVGRSGMTTTSALQNYLIDTDGNIQYPVLGTLHVAGKTKKELCNELKAKIYPHYIKENPIIFIRLANYKISVLGEVGKPGSYTIDNERITLFEALALAGDLTIFGKRDNVLLIRETADGKREKIRIDLRDSRLIDSPYYFLQQNDILYIQPNDPKSRSSELSTAETLSISVVGTLISLTTLIINLIK